jgi:hypothetical protein
MGDVVALLVKATGLHQTEDAAVPSSNPAPPHSLLNAGPGTMTVYQKSNLRMGDVSAWVKKQNKKQIYKAMKRSLKKSFSYGRERVYMEKDADLKLREK